MIFLHICNPILSFKVTELEVSERYWLLLCYSLEMPVLKLGNLMFFIIFGSKTFSSICRQQPIPALRRCMNCGSIRWSQNTIENPWICWKGIGQCALLILALWDLGWQILAASVKLYICGNMVRHNTCHILIVWMILKSFHFRLVWKAGSTLTGNFWYFTVKLRLVYICTGKEISNQPKLLAVILLDRFSKKIKQKKHT